MSSLPREKENCAFEKRKLRQAKEVYGESFVVRIFNERFDWYLIKMFFTEWLIISEVLKGLGLDWIKEDFFLIFGSKVLH